MMNEPACIDEQPSSRHPVLVANRHVLVREGIKGLVASVLRGAEWIDIEHGDHLLAAAQRRPQPRLAFIDLGMPGMHGGFRLVEMAHRHPTIPIVVLSMANTPDLVRRTMNIGSVRAFVDPQASADEIRASILAALQGNKLWPTSQKSDSRRLELTVRQQEIRRLMSEGLSNKMIAHLLSISEGTVKNHITSIFRALNATNRTQVARAHADLQAE